MPREQDFFEAFVWCVTLATALLWRVPESREVGSALFLAACMAGQLATIVGLRTQTAQFVRVGHMCFSASLWTGAVSVDGRPLALVCFLAAVSVATRWGLGHCMFAAARGSTHTNERMYDLFYLVPLFLSASRLASNCVDV